MKRYSAPAKVNLSLLVRPPRPDGDHPLESMVQTLEWCDGLEVGPGEEDDTLRVEGSELDSGENLVSKALAAARSRLQFRPLAVTLTKELPISAGLGGGSSDAAAMLAAVGVIAGADDATLLEIAAEVGADVPLFLTGGTMMMSGVGEHIESLRSLGGFAVSVVVPGFGLSTGEVYRRWDEMEGPEGDVVADELLPPSLRGGMPMRNDLLPAALSLEPRLGDFMADVRSEWQTAVCLTGSGSAVFGYFPDLAEARDAAMSVAGFAAVAKGVALRDRGVAPTPG